jgi:hypothetical protein
MHELTRLGRKYGTDKATTHTFTEKIYGPLLENRKDTKINLLELGAGRVGGSHKMWKEYFTRGEIYCLDPFFLPDQKVTIAELEACGVHVVRGNQLRRDDLHRIGSAAPEGYDVIIDDAAHMPDAIQLSLAILFPYLKSGGLYIVEDLATAARRGKAWVATNKNLDSLDSQKLMTERHVEEYILEEALEHFETNGEWLTRCLSVAEGEYLVRNIQQGRIFDDGMRKKNICVIKKK